MKQPIYSEIGKMNICIIIILLKNLQLPHSDYWLSARLAQSVECLTAEWEVMGLISWGLTNTQGLNKNNWEMKELSLHCKGLDLRVAQMTMWKGSPVSSWRRKNIVRISALVLIPYYTQIKCIFFYYGSEWTIQVSVKFSEKPMFTLE